MIITDYALVIILLSIGIITGIVQINNYIKGSFKGFSEFKDKHGTGISTALCFILFAIIIMILD